MLLIGLRSGNNSRFVKKFYLDGVGCRRLLPLGFRRLVFKSLGNRPSKPSQYSRRKSLLANSRVYSKKSYVSLFSNSFFTVFSEKISAYSNRIFGLVGFEKYISPLYLKKKKNLNKLSRSLHRSWSVLPLFYGYSVMSRSCFGSFFFFNSCFFFLGTISFLFLIKQHAFVYSVSAKFGRKFALSAGCMCVVVASGFFSNFVLLKLPSGAVKKF